MSAAETSAAERAEMRRQKILAKKQARMAYAAGDRSEPPSLAPVEPAPTRMAHLSTTLGNDEEGTVGRVGQGEDTMGIVSRHAEGRPSTVEAVGDTGQGGGRVYNESRGGNRSWKERFMWERVRVVLLMVVGVLSGAMSCCVEWSGMAEISVVHVFVVLEACMWGAEMMGGRHVEDGAGMMGGMVGTVMRATQIAGVMRRLWEDFAVFMVCMLGSVYVSKMV